MAINLYQQFERSNSGPKTAAKNWVNFYNRSGKLRALQVQFQFLLDYVCTDGHNLMQEQTMSECFRRNASIDYDKMFRNFFFKNQENLSKSLVFREYSLKFKIFFAKTFVVQRMDILDWLEEIVSFLHWMSVCKDVILMSFAAHLSSILIQECQELSTADGEIENVQLLNGQCKNLISNLNVAYTNRHNSALEVDGAEHILTKFLEIIETNPSLIDESTFDFYQKCLLLGNNRMLNIITAMFLQYLAYTEDSIQKQKIVQFLGLQTSLELLFNIAMYSGSNNTLIKGILNIFVEIDYDDSLIENHNDIFLHLFRDSETVQRCAAELFVKKYANLSDHSLIRSAIHFFLSHQKPESQLYILIRSLSTVSEDFKDWQKLFSLLESNIEEELIAATLTHVIQFSLEKIFAGAENQELFNDAESKLIDDFIVRFCEFIGTIMNNIEHSLIYVKLMLIISNETINRLLTQHPRYDENCNMLMSSLLNRIRNCTICEDLNNCLVVYKTLDQRSTSTPNNNYLLRTIIEDFGFDYLNFMHDEENSIAASLDNAKLSQLEILEMRLYVVAKHFDLSMYFADELCLRIVETNEVVHVTGDTDALLRFDDDQHQTLKSIFGFIILRKYAMLNQLKMTETANLYAEKFYREHEKLIEMLEQKTLIKYKNDFTNFAIFRSLLDHYRNRLNINSVCLATIVKNFYSMCCRSEFSPRRIEYNREIFDSLNDLFEDTTTNLRIPHLHLLISLYAKNADYNAQIEQIMTSLLAEDYRTYFTQIICQALVFLDEQFDKQTLPFVRKLTAFLRQYNFAEASELDRVFASIMLNVSKLIVAKRVADQTIIERFTIFAALIPFLKNLSNINLLGKTIQFLQPHLQVLKLTSMEKKAFDTFKHEMRIATNTF